MLECHSTIATVTLGTGCNKPEHVLEPPWKGGVPVPLLQGQCWDVDSFLVTPVGSNGESVLSTAGGRKGGLAPLGIAGQ